MLAPALREFIANGKSLRAISQLLNIDPKTIMSEAKQFNIPVLWKVKPSISKYQPSSSHSIQKIKKPKQQQTRPLKEHLTQSRLNWAIIDNECMLQIIQQAKMILQLSPPIRISVAELERRMGKKNWIYRYKEKIPKTMEQIDKHSESIDDYQTRRIQWVINQQWEKYGDIRVWRVMRQAGVRSSSLEKVTHLVNSVIEKHLL